MGPVRACSWRTAFFVWCSQLGLCKAPHDSGVCWKQIMMLLEEDLVCGGVPSPCTSRVGEGIRVRVTGLRSARAASVPPLSPQLLVASNHFCHLAISAAHSSANAKRQVLLVVRGPLVSPLGCLTKGLPSLKGGSVTSLCHPARSCARGAQSVKAVGMVKWARWR